MQTLSITAEKRTLTGKKVKRLRREGKIPANIFGKGIKSQAISVSLKEFEKVYKLAGETKIIEVVIGEQKLPTLIAGIQKNPVTDQILHVDFHHVDLKKKVSASVPVEFIGESPAEKQGLGTVVKYINEIEIEALPTDIPEKFTVDLSLLEKVGDQLLVSDLSFNKDKISISEEDMQKIIVKVEELREEEIVEEAPKEEAQTGEGVVEEATENSTSSEQPSS
jgi:large subunit ribosomal protein L25